MAVLSALHSVEQAHPGNRTSLTNNPENCS